MFLQAYASANLSDSVPNKNIRTALIVVHGLSGDANEYFCTALDALGQTKDLLVIAPWFGDEQLTSEEWGGAVPSGLGSTHWTTSNWMSGGIASPKPAKFTSSFDALDAVVERLTDGAAFPSLSRVVVSGFSAGGQMVNRYAWAMGADPSPTVAFAFSDPGTYLYLDPTRPAASCIPLRDTGAAANCSAYAAPDAADCPAYDSWKYGLADLPASGYRSLARFAGDAAAAAAQTARFARRGLRLLLGAADSCNCNTAGFANPAACLARGACTPSAAGACCDTFPDSTAANALSVGCEAMLQGSSRLQRGLLYAEHLRRQGAALEVAVEPGMGHDAGGFYRSEALSRWVAGG